jgi:hypothetical protein
MNNLVPGRECGECEVCCIVPAIDKPEMQKQPGAVCRNCVSGACGIYETRPNVCRTYYCGWRRLGILDDGWRPDKSGVLIESGGNISQFPASNSIVLTLVGNPLKTIRQHSFIDFVITSVKRNLVLFLSLPGPAGKQGGTLPLRTPEIEQAARQSRSHMRQELEKVLKRLSAHESVPYVMEHSGNDVSSQIKIA